MKCAPLTPMIFPRDASAIEDALASNRRGFVPQWRAPADAGTALHGVLARQLEIQGQGLNAMPQRLQLAFLGSLGANVLPAQPARAPLVFQLQDTASIDATVPAGTRAAAVLPPPAPSLTGNGGSSRPAQPEFFTEQEITAMRGTLATLYSIDPQADTYADHSSATPGDFAVFEARAPVPHRLYLGQSELFQLSGSAQIVLSFSFAASTPDDAAGSGRRPLLFDWEYLSVDGWQPLLLVEDGTERFTQDGAITLRKFHGPASKEDMVFGHISSWIRATVSMRIPAARIAQDGTALDDQGHCSVSVEPIAAIEPAIELHVGDLVTIDGSSTASVLSIIGNTLQLDKLLEGALAGEYLGLANGLPPLRPEGADAAGVLPQVDVIRARVALEEGDLTIGAAYLDSFKVDISKDFHPFGEQPQRFAAFYCSCKEAFPRIGGRIELHFRLTQLYSEYQDGSATPPTLQAEYYDGSRWLALGANDEYEDATASLTRGASKDDLNGVISFISPHAWVESELNGDKQHWLRLRIVEGDYGRPLAISIETDPDDSTRYTVKGAPSTLKPPIIASLTVSYSYVTNPMSLDFCVTENDFAFSEHSEDSRSARRPFTPFTPVSDLTPALHFGFSGQPPSALVSVLVQVLEPAVQGDPQPLVWDYWGARGWTELSVRDATAGLKQTGLVQFVGAPDALPRDGLGGALYRIRARLKSWLISRDQIVRCGGAWLNAVWARQGQRVDRDGLGISNGNPEQSFALPLVRAAPAAPIDREDTAVLNAADFDRALDAPIAGVAVLAGEVVEVREWRGRGDDWQTVVAGVAAADLRFEADPQDPAVKTAVWVRWQPQPHLYRSGPGDRHYVVERARGVFRFPGVDGFIPPAGCPIVASYVTGGGVEGNVPIGTIHELRSGVGFVRSVSNPLAAGGGAGAELLRAARDRSAQTVRHRGRAVSNEDYEWLAREASSEVARVRALPLQGPDGAGSRGFVGIVLVPHSLQTQPLASPQLCSTVLAYLGRYAPAGIAGGLRIVAPSYLPVGVRAEILPLVAEEAGEVEAQIRASLTRFLHPLYGGRDGRGWDFGASVYLSDAAALIEEAPGVDALQSLHLMVGQALYGDSVPVEPQQLITAGDSQLKIIVPRVPYALA